MDSQFNHVLFTTAIVIFSIAAIVMLLAPLLIGWLVRPKLANEEKDAIYECGEPTIGSSNVQFDLRFYVVALLFIVFDVEVAFFFPWAVVFGKANSLANSGLKDENRQMMTAKLLEPVDATGQPIEFAKDAAGKWVQVSLKDGERTEGPITVDAMQPEAASLLMKLAVADLLVFFGVVLVGFAYVWLRGDLDWVRAVAHERAMQGTT